MAARLIVFSAFLSRFPFPLSAAKICSPAGGILAGTLSSFLLSETGDLLCPGGGRLFSF